ncbi:hypothetical protein [Paraburkholderia nemoris]|nr:hypothetical protein [Paraburkholderia nemoris]
MSVSACQKWPKPMSYSVAADWKPVTWTLGSDLPRLARKMMAVPL